MSAHVFFDSLSHGMPIALIESTLTITAAAAGVCLCLCRAVCALDFLLLFGFVSEIEWKKKSNVFVFTFDFAIDGRPDLRAFLWPFVVGWSVWRHKFWIFSLFSDENTYKRNCEAKVKRRNWLGAVVDSDSVFVVNSLSDFFVCMKKFVFRRHNGSAVSCVLWVYICDAHNRKKNKIIKKLKINGTRGHPGQCSAKDFPFQMFVSWRWIERCSCFVPFFFLLRV